jgi:hypothetical protein
MAFITRCCKKNRFEGGDGMRARALQRIVLSSWVSLAKSLKGFALALLLTLGGLGGVWAQSANTVGVNGFELERQDDAYYLSATLAFELPLAVEDALTKGVPLFFLAQTTVSKERWYWYEKTLAQQERYYKLSYLPLTGRYRLLSSSKPISNSGLGVTMGVAYDSLSQALFAVSRLSHWRVVDAGEIEAGGKYRLDFQFKLDLTQFPKPLQIGALGENDWNLSLSKSQRLNYEPLK